MRAMAWRFGAGSVIALAVLIATGAAMASRTDRWDDDVLQLKLMLLVVVGVLTALHVTAPGSRVVSIAVLLGSLAMVWLGVALSHG